MKKLNNKSFWLVLSGIIISLASSLLGLFLVEEVDLSQFEGRLTEEQLQTIINTAKMIVYFVVAVAALISAYFIYRLITNKKAAAGQGYLTFLFVINIIGVVFNSISLITGNFLSLIDIAVNVLIIVGRTIQKNYIPPVNNDVNPFDYPSSDNTNTGFPPSGNM